MLELTVNLDERSYPIYIGKSALQDNGRLVHHIGDCRPIIITNDTIAPLYLQKLLDSLAELNPLSFIIPDGEQYKSLEWFEKISAFLLQNNCGRDTCLIALGGGVVGDLTGFVAACYQRGVPFIQIPTTLLSQVDSSVGGKTAVNHPLGKNMIGAFYQPQAVFIDTQSLHTLPAREFAAGMAEVIKYGLIYDTDLFSYLEQHVTDLQQLDEVCLQHIIFRCCEIKALIVAQDEKEHGLRALLNLGHTFAHAIEAQMGYGVWLHGEAVATGMVLAAKLANAREDLSADEVTRIIDVIAQYNLPTKIPTKMTSEQFLTHMRKDKKNKKGTIRFILPTQFGQCALVDDVSDDQVRDLIEQ
ncbi:3-dehydroquinate synthase [Pseudoalteromonas sp. SG45-5]|jgi:3-dehydroquinate synthase|uniref:3-dehydroquinate synthase n=1 Tax=Pseudoalteromonas aliena TaxID=247523 RepID=A0A1Q2GWG1_9GAMM|nr:MULTISPECIES: 3-dehydroquinate synthase [Pseudoalteromonas]AQP99471.1 3-dehydroquinate synthase [Pseudoalteromonas aliena]MBB1385426.1 3-dehydroquinate synthase [Pseudoalteromonas sp. SG45-5]MBB1393384.1 3-dehydroquinate synthase [Pseudoalteromonas sp. SG44-4]MBB1447853.1 3-dehydroquinate synthase [Pseudoalteromonas sp. SG41-6]TMO05921.1 3-dehydroquinate synthase [Pseudoalteromonas sp. S558]